MHQLPKKSNVKPLIYDLSLEEIKSFTSTLGESDYRAGQIWQGLYNSFWSLPDHFTTLSKTLREQLAERMVFTSLEPKMTLKSKDQQTTKVLFHLPDLYSIETELMQYDKRNTLCISTQSGCTMGCVFCATGQMGFKRHLTSGEIIEQVLIFSRNLINRGEKLTNIVVMGMGEPFHNYQATMKAIDRLNDHDGINMGERRITISTAGIVPMILKFADEKRQVNLAISLHAANDPLRNSLMPINKKYPINLLLEACHYYVNKTNRRISFEWALIQGINDSINHVMELIQLLRGLTCHVNIIQLNPTHKYRGKPTTRQRAEAFQKELESSGIPCTIRLRRGIDIQAGCGQLAAEIA